MSTLFVESVKFDVMPHPNADRLSIAKVRGKAWQCVFNKEQWGLNVGDVGEGVYFPIDSVLPENLINVHGLEGMTHEGRIRTVRLRGEISQGLLLPFGGDIPPAPEGSNLTDHLGIKKFEPVIPKELLGEVEEVAPECWKHYSGIENIKNFPNIFNEGEEVVTREKLHGLNTTILKWEKRLWVSSHSWLLKFNKDNVYWKAVLPYAETLLEALEEGQQICGEVLGPQDLKYGYTKDKPGIRFYDLCEGHNFVNDEDMEAFVIKHLGKDLIAPVLYKGVYDYDKIIEVSNGQSLIAKNKREGSVTKAVVERYDSKVGRAIIKSISDKYLSSSSEKTEFH